MLSDSAARKYHSIGTVGAAILGTQEAGQFRIVLYLPTQERVCEENVSANTSCVVQADLFLNLGAAGANWSLKFGSTNDRVGNSVQSGVCVFLRRICIV